MAFYKGEIVEVWSNGQRTWIPNAEILEAPEADCVIDGYSIPRGALKVTSAAGMKWILPDQVPSTVRKVQAAVSEEPPPPPPPPAAAAAAAGAPAHAAAHGPGMCKHGCGRPVQPGLTRGMKAFDTCCKKCSMSSGRGGHDANCGGHTPTGVVRKDTGIPDPRHWLEDMVASEAALQAHTQVVLSSISGDTSGGINAAQVKEAVARHLLDPIGTRLNVDDRAAADWVRMYGDGGPTIDAAAFEKLLRMLLQDRLKHWFPTKLCAKTHNFVRKNPIRADVVYEFGKLLGEGSFGKVYKVQHKISGETRVCKKIAKMKGREGMKVEEILQEIESMAMLDHPNVIKVYEYFEDADSVSQIMEPCSGGELQDRIDAVYQKGQPCYSEEFVCDVMKQTLRALAFMHGNNFMHKDLKPQNIMLVDRESSSIKVIDFGLAELFTPDQKHSDAFGGTLLYMAPEVFKYKLVMKSDIWSAGVILYNLLTGDYPFMATWPLPPGKTMEWWQSELSRSIQEDRFRNNRKLQDGSWSPECIDLLSKMLEKDLARRPDAAGCLEHQFFKKFESTPPPLSIGVTQCLEAFAGQPELKKALFLLIAHMCTAPALQELRSIFTHFDTQNRGCLETSHFRDVLYRSGMSALQVEKIVHALDQDASGTVEWTEFIAAALCVSVCGNRKLVEAAFSVFDKDCDGKVSQQDFVDMFALGKVREVWMRCLPHELTYFGTPGLDGKYSKEQFTNYMGKRMAVTAGDALAAVH